MSEVSNNPPPDTTLASNFVTAFVPTLGVVDKTVHVLDCARVGFKRLLFARTAPSFDGLRPPGDVPGAPSGPGLHQAEDDAGGAPLEQLARASTPMMRSRETWRDLPQLPVSEFNNAAVYYECQYAAFDPDPTDAFGVGPFEQRKLDRFSPGVEDAFHSKTSDGENILPDSVLNSSLVNAYTDYPANIACGIELVPGRRSHEVLNQLSDRKTGFVAGITYHPSRREVVIGFPCANAAGMQIRQLLRCAMNWLGFVPKNMSQASKLTRLVKAHIDQLNEDLPDDQEIKLTLAGHSMGGALASYAALRNKVSAVVFNPLRLGWGARARCRQHMLQEADRYITEIVVQGDSIADSHLSKLYVPQKLFGLGFDSRGPVGNARRFMLPAVQGVDRHNGVPQCLNGLRARDNEVRERLPSSQASLRAASPRAHGDLLAGNARRAVKEAAGAAVEETLVRMNLPESEERALRAQVKRLPDLVQRVVFPTSVEDVDQAKSELHDLFNHLEKRLVPYPSLLDDLRSDLLPAPRAQTPRTLSSKAARLLGQ